MPQMMIATIMKLTMKEFIGMSLMKIFLLKALDIVTLNLWEYRNCFLLIQNSIRQLSPKELASVPS